MANDGVVIREDGVRFITIQECDFAFQNCVENKDFENIVDYYESIKQIYRKKLKDSIPLSKLLSMKEKYEKGCKVCGGNIITIRNEIKKYLCPECKAKLELIEEILK